MSCCCALHAPPDPAEARIAIGRGRGGPSVPMPDGHGRVGRGDAVMCPACPQHGRPAPDIEALAAALHGAWMEGKQAQGWADHPMPIIEHDTISTMGLLADLRCVECGRAVRRHHPNMVPYASLHEADKDLDRKMVLTVLRAMEVVA